MKTLLSFIAFIPLFIFGQTPLSIEYLPNLNYARSQHQQIAISANKFMICGGHVNGFGITRNAEIYDASTKTWNTVLSQTSHDMGYIAKLNNGKFLIGAGCSSNSGIGQLANSEIFDPSDNSFAAAANMKVARTMATAATLKDGRVLVVGNWYASAAIAEVYDPVANTFTSTGGCLVERSLPVIIPTDDGGAIICGGIGTRGAALSRHIFEKYNPVTNTFTELATTLFNGETSWDILCYYPTLTNQYLMPNGKYAVLVYNTAGTVARLISVDPATSKIEEIVTQKPIPLADETDATKKFGCSRTLMIDHARNLLHIIQQGGTTANIVLRIVTINLKTGSVNTSAPKDGFDYSLVSSNLSMLSDGRILFTGGVKFDNFNLSNKAFIVTPETYSTNYEIDCEKPFAIHKYYDKTASSGYRAFKASPQGGYFGVVYNNMGDQRQLKIDRIDDKGSILWTKNIHTYPYIYANKDMGLVDADIAEDGSLYILTSIYYSWNVSYNEVFHVSATGDSIWNKMVSSNGEYTKPVYNSIKCTPTGGCVIIGSTNGAPNTPSVRKINKAGEIQWTNNSFTSDNGYNGFYAVSVNKNGEIFMTGKVHNNLNGRQSFLVAKVDSLGVNKWDKVYHSGFSNSGDSIYGWGNSISYTDDGGCIVGGYASEKGRNDGHGAAILKKLDAEGNILWEKKHFKNGYYPFFETIIKLNEPNRFIAFADQYAGSTNSVSTVMKFTDSGDSLWIQKGFDYRLSMSGIDKNNNVLFCASSPHSETNWEGQALLYRTTSGGIYQTPQLWAAPYDNDKNVSLQPKFYWSETSHIGVYKLQISTDSLFSSIAYEAADIQRNGESGFSYHTLTTSLLPKIKYFSRVQIVGPEGCPSAWSDIRRFTTLDNTGIDNQKADLFKLYPNPANKDLFIEIDNNEFQNSKIEIFDLTGKTVYQLVSDKMNYSNKHIVIDISGFNNGLYNCRLSNDKVWFNRKFIVNK